MGDLNREYELYDSIQIIETNTKKPIGFERNEFFTRIIKAGKFKRIEAFKKGGESREQ